MNSFLKFVVPIVALLATYATAKPVMHHVRPSIVTLSDVSNSPTAAEKALNGKGDEILGGFAVLIFLLLCYITVTCICVCVCMAKGCCGGGRREDGFYSSETVIVEVE